MIAQVGDEEWDRFAERTGSVFATRDWLDAWSGTGAIGRSTEDLVLRGSDGRIEGALLLGRRRLLGTTRPVGPWPAPGPSVLSLPSDRARVTQQLLRSAAESDGRRSIGLLVPADDAALRPGALLIGPPTSDRSIVLEGADWEDLLERSGKNSRKSYLRRSRRLHENHAVRFRLADDPERLESDVDLLLELHGRRWEGAPAVFGPERRAVLQRFAAASASRGRLVLRFLELDGAAAAAQLSVRFAGAETALVSAADPALRAEQVGIEMLFATVQNALDAGMRELRLLPGDEDYKQRLPSVDHPVQQVVVPLSPLAGVVARGRQRAGRLRRRAAGRFAGTTRSSAGARG